MSERLIKLEFEMNELFGTDGKKIECSLTHDQAYSLLSQLIRELDAKPGDTLPVDIIPNLLFRNRLGRLQLDSPERFDANSGSNPFWPTHGVSAYIPVQVLAAEKESEPWE